MLVKEANEITGGLSSPSKMPGKAYSLPATRCKVGSKLVRTPGSVCHGCYALKGMYRFPKVKDALERRYQSLTDERWVEAMVTLIEKQSPDYFRWHDSGDIQSVSHLKRICDVVDRTPATSHWLPTREVKFVRTYLQAYGPFPLNLVVRVSSPMVDGPPLPYDNTSTVVSHHEADTIRNRRCPAPDQDNECKDCRACWHREIANVAYSQH
jgi:hypothetical protein